jgi:hypothetical protein
MAEKTLGQVAWEAMDAAWSLPAEESWQAVADAVIQAHEARRWKGICTAPLTGEVLVGKWHRGEWMHKATQYIAIAIEDGYTHWTPIPAPPQEVERG